jgi:monoamine oxidase
MLLTDLLAPGRVVVPLRGRTKEAVLRELLAAALPNGEAGFSYSWYQDPYAMGGYALFEPDQQSDFLADISRPEGRIHFAGEHSSRWPAWMEGAVESGIRAAMEVHAGVTEARIALTRAGMG